MRIGELGKDVLRARCRGQGLDFRTGPFSVRVQTRLPAVIAGIALLYADFPLAEAGAYIDFSVVLEGSRRWNRPLHPQVRFQFEGRMPFQPLPRHQSFAMFEWGLNWCVSTHAHEYLIVHAAALERGGYAVILPAPPGSGKSTLCAALIQRGWRLLSDELALIRIADGQLVPLPRPVSLKNASVALIRAYQADAVISAPVRDTIKGSVAHLRPPSSSVLRADQACRLAWVIFPEFAAGAELRFRPLSRARGFLRVADQAFNYSLLGRSGFTTLADAIANASCHDLRFASLDAAVSLFDTLVAPTP